MSSSTLDALLRGLPEELPEKMKALAEKYTLTSRNDEGANGFVFFGLHTLLNQDVAIKVYYWGGDEDMHVEPQVLVSLDAPNVLRVLDADRLTGEWAYFVTPRCNGGSLDDFLRSRGDKGLLKCLNLFRDVLNGAAALHGRRLLHRDLKPGNIFVHNECAVIGDFGSIAALPSGASAIHASKHAMLYRPPEAVTASIYGIQSDVYQLGLVLYQMLGGHLPYAETAWLSQSEQKIYMTKSYPDNTIYANVCLGRRIERGRLLDFNTLDPWVPRSLVRVIRQATDVRLSRRQASVGHVLTDLNKAATTCGDWALREGFPTRLGETSYRIVGSGPYRVQKKRTGEWRHDNSFGFSEDQSALIRSVCAHVR